MTTTPFDLIFKYFILPLNGKEIITFTGEVNKVLEINNSYISRCSSLDNTSKIAMNYIRLAFNELIKKRRLTRDEINKIYSNASGDSKRGSSFIFALLATLPFVIVDESPAATLLIDFEKYSVYWNELKK